MAAIQRIHCRDEDEDMGVSNGDDVSTSTPAEPIIWSVADSGCVLCLRVDASERYALFGGYVLLHILILRLACGSRSVLAFPTAGSRPFS